MKVGGIFFGDSFGKSMLKQKLVREKRESEYEQGRMVSERENAPGHFITSLFIIKTDIRTGVRLLAFYVDDVSAVLSYRLIGGIRLFQAGDAENTADSGSSGGSNRLFFIIRGIVRDPQGDLVAAVLPNRGYECSCNLWGFRLYNTG